MMVILLQGAAKNYERQLAYLDAPFFSDAYEGFGGLNVGIRRYQPPDETLSASFRLAILSRKVRKNFDRSFSLTVLMRVERRMMLCIC